MNALQSRVRARWGIVALVVVAILGAIVFALDRFVLSVSPLLGPGLAVVLLVLVVVYVQALYRSWGYRLDDDALELERGVITSVETAVPYVRVQHVDTQRGPLDRLFGLGRVVVYTAGSRGADVTIPGLEPNQARELRNRLRDLAIESEPEDAV
ncbi:PH domain-containing protein [Halorientalis sp.]|jgi:membrane protein YdbS with pleckstrin-like domain|uniref:PH domain-containing protein n=1 Tax=Halorientalis sp. TaxID=1931229 RepID=UPI0026185278|nr:PH domain-containing protein [Halorientalis sp.]